MTYVLGAASQRELQGVHAQLVAVVQRAIAITTQDFCVYDGLRTVAEQKANVAKGVSKTMNSKHLQGRAVDLVPWVGKPVWDWPLIYPVAAAMCIAAREVKAPIVWGAVWDMRLIDLAPGVTNLDRLADALRREGLAYNDRHPGKDFPDGPHFELVG